MSLDTHNDHNPSAPWNQEELPELSELEQLQEDYSELRDKLITAKERIKWCITIAEQGENTLLLNNLKKIKL